MRIERLAWHQEPGSSPAQEDFVLGEREKGILVIADGFGGPEAGAMVARASAEAVRGFLVKEAGDLEATLPFVLRSYFSLAGNVLFNSMVHANRKANLWNKKKSVHQRGGASLLAGFLDGDLLALANAGACSAWLLRGELFSELVVPRVYGRLVDPFAESVASEYRAPLTALGCAEDVEPEIFEYRVRAGDRLLLTTGGTSLSKESLSALARLESFDLSLEHLRRALKERHLEGNASVLLASFA